MPDLSSGLCVGQGPAAWFPAVSHGPTHARRAENLCDGCPVLLACYRWGLCHEADGIWGGTTPGDRRRLRRAMGLQLQTPGCPPEPCGTEAAYKRHLWAGEQTCAACREAHRRYEAGRRGAAWAS